MKISTLLFGLALAGAPAMAQVAALIPAAPTVSAPKLATATPFITDLKEPQGMALDGAGNLLVCDYGAGEILKFASDGKPLGKFAQGLKGPAAIVSVGSQVFVSERKANRVLRFRDGKMDVILADIPEPMGLVADGVGTLMNPPSKTPVAFALSVISHTTSKIYRLENLGAINSDKIPRLSDLPVLTPLFRSRSNAPKPTLIYSAPSTNGDRYGFRWLVRDGNGYLMSDEVGERVLMLTENGRVATFASGISDPSGLAIGPDKQVYVANEGDGGQLIRLSAEGEKTVVAEKLGRPRGILFLDAKTVLISNRDGNIWKIILP